LGKNPEEVLTIGGKGGKGELRRSCEKTPGKKKKVGKGTAGGMEKVEGRGGTFKGGRLMKGAC